MNDNKSSATIVVTPELEDLLRAFEYGQQHSQPFSLVDMLTMAALVLAKNGPIAVEDILRYAEQEIWPTVVRETAYDDAFDSYRSIAAINARAVVQALQDPEPCEAILAVARSLPNA